jgi:microcystin-dependent protein
MNKGWEGSTFTSYEGGGQAHNNIQPYFVTNFIVKAKQGKIANDNTEGVTTNLLLDVYPIGSIYMSVNNVNPSTLFGGTWESWGAGRVPIGVDTTQTEFATVEKTGGEKTHTLTIEEIPSHSHSTENVAAFNSESGGWTIPNGNYQPLKVQEVLTKTTGGNQPHNNLQPYITCYMWKRVS